MLTADEKQELRLTLDALARQLPGYKERRQQLRLMNSVALTVAKARAGADIALVADAPTGSGKSQALTLPAIVMGRRRGLRIILSSSTTSLQHQLMTKDLPALARAVCGSFSYAIAKGRGRYFCPARAEQSAQGLTMEADAAATTSAAAEHLLEMWRAGAWDGDRDRLPARVDDAAWEEVTNNAKGCVKRSCHHQQRCPYHLAKSQVLKADVVVANHRLLVEAAASPEGTVLPPLGQSVLLIDEAHNLSRIATDAWSRTHSLRATARWIDRQLERLRRSAEASGQGPAEVAALEDSLDDLTEALRALADGLDARSSGAPFRRFKQGQLPPGLQRAGTAITRSAAAARDVCERARQALIASGGSRSDGVTALAAAASRLEAVLSTWQLVTCNDGAPIATWVEATDNDYRISSCLVDSGAQLRQSLWQRAAGVVAASATLTQCGSFEAFLRDSGLDRCSDVQTLKLASPFDYASRAVLTVPRMRHTPKNIAGHTDEVVRLLPAYLSPRGSLILCASRRQMLDIHAALPHDIKADVLMQDSMGRAALLATHAERVRSGARSILLGLASMGEGVDLPGELCESVVIAKLTFAVPTHPVEQARAEWIEARGQSAFEHIALMAASVSLSQQVGRLLRTETDSGRVTVLDTRLATTRWGRKLLDGLPPFQRDLLRGAAH